MDNAMPDLDPSILAYLKASGIEPGMLTNFDQRAFNIRSDDLRRSRDEDAYRARMGEEGARSWRQLLDILHGGAPSRDPNYEPPPRPAQGQQLVWPRVYRGKYQ